MSFLPVQNKKSNDVNFFDPTAQVDIKRKRMMADMLMKQSQQRTGTDVVSGIAIKQSPLDALSKALGQGVAGYQTNKADTQEKEFEAAKRQKLSEALSQYSQNPQAAAAALAQIPGYETGAMSLMAAQSKAQADAAREERRFGNARDVARIKAGADSGITFDDGTPVNGGGVPMDGQQYQAPPPMQPPSDPMNPLPPPNMSGREMTSNPQALAAAMGGQVPPMQANQLQQPWTPPMPSNEGGLSAPSPLQAPVMPPQMNAQGLPPVDPETAKQQMLAQQLGGQGQMVPQQIQPINTVESQVPPMQDNNAFANMSQAPQQEAPQPRAIYLKGKPVTDGLREGQQWAVDPQSGARVAMNIPGYTSKDQQKMQASLPGAIASSEQAISTIDKMLGGVPDPSDPTGKKILPEHPGLSNAVGTSSMFPTIPGGDTSDFEAMLDQVKGSAFLEAYKTLRGSGAIANQEGARAEAAVARLNKAQSEPAFRESLKEYRDIIAKGIERQKQMAAGGQTQQPQGGVIDAADYFNASH